MQLALQQADAAVRLGEVPIGAVIVKDGKIIASAHNLTETRKDPTAHAELLVIRQACETLKTPRLVDCDIYVTLEPCAMCAAAISFARLRRLYYGAPDEKGGAVAHGARFFSQTTCHHKPEIYGSINENECGEVLKSFFKEKR